MQLSRDLTGPKSLDDYGYIQILKVKIMLKLKDLISNKICHTVIGIAITLILCGGSAITLTGCVKPYRVDIQQGNVLDEQVVQKLAVGMSKHEVEELLGAPVLGNAFGSDSWSYVYTNQISGGKIEKKQLIVHFAKDKLSKIEKSSGHEQS
jgi:outer membrane protein assembly factor BamE